MATLTKSALLASAGPTTPLGFGTATLGRLDDAAEIDRMIGCACDAGILHFDTARLYGHGTMEGQLGRCLRGRRSEITIATKFGLDPAPVGAVSAKWLGRIKRLVKKVGFLRGAARSFAARATTGNYTPSTARASFQKSLHELGTDYVDVLFIHEGTPADVTNEGLLDFLREEKQAGRVRAFGLAAGWATVEQLTASALQSFDVLQIPFDASTDHLARVREKFSGPIITHSVFAPLLRVRAFLQTSDSARREWSARLAMDVSDPAVLPRLLLHASLRQNSSGVTLFSATRAANIRANVDALQNPPDGRTLDEFSRLIAGTSL